MFGLHSISFHFPLVHFRSIPLFLPSIYPFLHSSSTLLLPSSNLSLMILTDGSYLIDRSPQGLEEELRLFFAPNQLAQGTARLQPATAADARSQSWCLLE